MRASWTWTVNSVIIYSKSQMMEAFIQSASQHSECIHILKREAPAAATGPRKSFTGSDNLEDGIVSHVWELSEKIKKQHHFLCDRRRVTHPSSCDRHL